MATARPGIRAVDLAEVLKVSERTVFRDLAELQRLGFPVTFGNGYPAQQELFKRRRRQEMAQILADLVDQQLQVVRRKLPPEEADRPYSPVELATAEKLHRKAIVGATAQVAARLKELAKSLDLDELVVVTWTYDPAPRHRSYELLAQAFELEKTAAR